MKTALKERWNAPQGLTLNRTELDWRAAMQSTEPETWKPIPGYEGYYEVSDHGRVRSLDRVVNAGPRAKRRKATGRILSPGVDTCGYEKVQLSVDGRAKLRSVHHLVLEAFVGPRPHGWDGCHNDGNSRNNHRGNLRWDTRSENHRDAVRHGTYRNGGTDKTHCPRGHSLTQPNLVAATLRRGGRACRACARARTRAWYHGVSVTQEMFDDAYREILAAPNHNEQEQR